MAHAKILSKLPRLLHNTRLTGFNLGLLSPQIAAALDRRLEVWLMQSFEQAPSSSSAPPAVEKKKKQKVKHDAEGGFCHEACLQTLHHIPTAYHLVLLSCCGSTLAPVYLVAQATRHIGKSLVPRCQSPNIEELVCKYTFFVKAVARTLSCT